MEKLTRTDLMSLEDYSAKRAEFREKVMEHKKARRIELGTHVTLYFEDRLTIQYQVQEMLRAERIFEADGIQEELDAYNPLIPDSDTLKATMMIEFEDAEERRAALAQWGGIEDRVWIARAGGDRCYAIADEDLERRTKERTSAVHFLNFKLDGGTAQSVRDGGKLAMGVDHELYTETVDPVPEALARSLANDLR